MPLGAELVFKFALLGTGRERHVVSKGYRIVSDKLGTELNYLRVFDFSAKRTFVPCVLQ
jgi:hypothetical protein